MPFSLSPVSRAGLSISQDRSSEASTYWTDTVSLIWKCNKLVELSTIIKTNSKLTSNINLKRILELLWERKTRTYQILTTKGFNAHYILYLIICYLTEEQAMGLRAPKWFAYTYIGVMFEFRMPDSQKYALWHVPSIHILIIKNAKTMPGVVAHAWNCSTPKLKQGAFQPGLDYTVRCYLKSTTDSTDCLVYTWHMLHLPERALWVFPTPPWAGWLQLLLVSAESLAQFHRRWALLGLAAGMHSPHAALGGHFLALQAPAKFSMFKCSILSTLRASTSHN